LLEHFGCEVAKNEAAGANLGLRFQDRTVLVKRCEMTREVVKVVAKEIRAIFVGNTFKDQAEVEKVFREC